MDGLHHRARVEIAPHLDLWAMGARYGEVVRIDRATDDRGPVYTVKLDRYRKPVRVRASDIARVIKGRR